MLKATVEAAKREKETMNKWLKTKGKLEDTKIRNTILGTETRKSTGLRNNIELIDSMDMIRDMSKKEGTITDTVAREAKHI